MPEVQFSVVVAVFNESENLAPLLAEIATAFEGKYAYEVVYVDDGSTDDTLARLTTLKSQYPRLRVLASAPRSGKSFAMHTGVKAAQAPWILALDGDGQNDPADLPAICEMVLKAGPQLGLVGGIRRKRRDTISKRIGSRVGNGIRQFFLRDGCPDTGCGVKVFRRDAYLDLPVFEGQHRFMPALFQSRGWGTEYVLINDRLRERGVSKYNNFQRALVGVPDLIGVAWLKRRARTPKAIER